MSEVSNTEMRKTKSTSKDQFRVVDDSVQSEPSHLHDLSATENGYKENRIEDRLSTEEQPCYVTVDDLEGSIGQVVDISPRGMGIVLNGSYSIKPDAKVELFYKQFLIIGSVANVVQLKDCVRIGISISERHRDINQTKQ